MFDARVRRFPCRLEQRIKLRVEANGPRAVDDATLHLRPKVHLHHVAVLCDGVGNISKTTKKTREKDEN